MEFLKDLFGDGAMTYEQFSEAAKAKGISVASGADVDNLNTRLNTVSGQLADANKKLEGFDPEWKAKADAAKTDLERQAFEFSLEKSVSASKPRNAKAVMALLDREKLSFAGGEVIGLEKQLETLKKADDTAFLFEVSESRPSRTGMSHQGGREAAADKKDAANEALRSAFGKGN